jgi:hypothetical protein
VSQAKRDSVLGTDFPAMGTGPKLGYKEGNTVNETRPSDISPQNTPDISPSATVRVTVDRTKSLSQSAFVFRKDTWQMQLDSSGKGLLALKGAPETWSALEDWAEKPKWLLAAISCPKCKMPSVLSRAVHTIGKMGRVSPDFICTQLPLNYGGHECRFHRTIYLDHWNKKPLYAVAYEERTPAGKWTANIEYCHASTPAEARFHIGPGNYKIVAIGRAIGYNVLDKEGLVLSV